MTKEWRPDDWIWFIGCEHKPACAPHEIYEAGASAMLAAVIRWGDALCENDKHDGGYWEGGGLDCNGSPIKGKFHYDKRFNCPQCINELRGEK